MNLDEGNNNNFNNDLDNMNTNKVSLSNDKKSYDDSINGGENPRRVSESHQAQIAAKDLAKATGNTYLQSHGVPGPIAGAVTSKIADNPIVSGAIGGIAKSNPLIQKNLAKAQPIINKAKPLVNAAISKKTSNTPGEDISNLKSGGFSKGISNNNQKSPKDPIESIDNSTKSLSNMIEKGVENTVALVSRVSTFLHLVPILLPILLFVFIVLGIFIIIFTSLSGSEKHYADGYGGYSYHPEYNCPRVTVVDSPYAGTYELEDYVAGVVAAEVRGLKHQAVYETFAIAARTYFFSRQTNCTIKGNTQHQAFIPLEELSSEQSTIELIKSAATITRGLILFTEDNKLASTEYDAFAWTSKNSENYVLVQKSQIIPISWVETHVSKNYLNCTPYSHSNGVVMCSSHHGRGMSQYGAWYLAEQGMGAHEILSYYYENAVIGTILGATPGNLDFALQVTPNNSKQLDMRFDQFLANNGSSIEEFNTALKESIRRNSPGTRTAVASAALIITTGLYQRYGFIFPYTYGGGHYITELNSLNPDFTNGVTFGVDGTWGSPISYTANVSGSNITYYKFGPDCSGFVAWAIYNGGFKSVVSDSSSFASTIGDNKGDRYKGKIGDLVYHPGHIMMIVGLDDEKSEYYIAEASGKENGVRVKKMKYYSKGENIVDMSKFYDNQNNINPNF